MKKIFIHPRVVNFIDIFRRCTQTIFLGTGPYKDGGGRGGEGLFENQYLTEIFHGFEISLPGLLILKSAIFPCSHSGQFKLYFYFRYCMHLKDIGNIF